MKERSRFRLTLWNTEDPFSLRVSIFFRLRICTNIISMLPHSIPWIWCYVMKFPPLYLSSSIFVLSPVSATMQQAKWFCFETVDGEHVVRLFVSVERRLLLTWSTATAADRQPTSCNLTVYGVYIVSKSPVRSLSLYLRLSVSFYHPFSLTHHQTIVFVHII